MQSHVANRFGVAGSAIAVLAVMASVLIVVPSRLSAISSVASSGYYDEPWQTNTVDFEAAGSTPHYNEVTQMVRVAYCDGFAGVYQCEIIAFNYYIGLDYALDNWGFHRKVIVLNTENIGIGPSGTDWDAISGSGRCVDTTGGDLYFEFGQIFYGEPDERLVALGFTILSCSVTNYGRVVAIAHFTDGTTASASRVINETRGLGDTFFGFRAPPGAGLTRVDISSETGMWIAYDDLVFFTATPDGGRKLNLRRLPAEQLEISWAATCNHYVLESALSLASPQWVAVTNTVEVSRERFSVTVPVPVAKTTEVFRLRLVNE